MLEIDHGSTWYCTCTCKPWQIVSQDLLQFRSDNESDRQMAHRHTCTLTHLLFIKLSEFSPSHNAGSNSAKCVGILLVTNTLRSNQARIFSPAPTMEQSKLTLVNYLQPFSLFLDNKMEVEWKVHVDVIQTLIK